MTRALHLWLGRAAGLFLVILAITGAVLAIDATGTGVSAPPPAPAGLSVADLAAGLSRRGALEQITVTPAGTILARAGGSLARLVVDPTTLELRPAAPQSGFVRLATEIHRTLTLGDAGRFVLAAATLAGLALAATGLGLAARVGPGRDRTRRFHRAAGFAVAVPLVVSTVTGLGLAAAAFFPLAVAGRPPAFPTVLADGPPLPLGEMAALKAVAVADLEELVLPRRGDPDDVLRLTTVDRFALIDPATGRIAAQSARPEWHRIATALLRLHGGQGLPAVAIALGLAGAALPMVAASGLFFALPRRRRMVGRDPGVGAAEADTIVLVGTQGGTTRGFADRLAATLSTAGHRVHLAAMNEVAAHYPRARRLLILTSTHGEGTAPASADRFLARLGRLATPPPFAVLGFGERDARRYCGFAEDVDTALRARGAPTLLPLRRIHRRSEADYAAWVEALLATHAALPAPRVRPTPPRPAPAPRSERRVLVGPAMGSRWTATVHVDADADLAPLAAGLARRIGRIEAALSRFRPGSEVLRVDEAPLDAWIAISEDLAGVLAVGLEVGRRSGGAFDVGLAAEVAAAGFGGGWARAGTRRVAPVAAHEALDLDLDRRRLRKRAPLSLDLAGIAKGWAVDRLDQYLADAGHAAHLVGLDGELRAGSARPDGSPWAIGLEAPAIGLRTTLGRLDLIDRAVATSGDYRRFGGGGHTLDPATGRPRRDGPASVTTIAATCAAADAWATALMVTGEAGLDAARAAGVEAIFVARGPRRIETAAAGPTLVSTPGPTEGRWRAVHP